MWADIYKLWSYATTKDAYSRWKRNRAIEGAGVTQPDAIPDIRADGSYWSGGNGVIRLRDSTDFIDLSSVTNRQSRYKEYERLRSTTEIETAMTVYADETCVVGSTRVATPTYGYISIQKLAEIKKPEETFLVYCYDFSKADFTLGWAYHPRIVKKAKTVRVVLDNGTDFACTEDHRVLTKAGVWKEAGNLATGDELMPFYRVRPSVLTHKKNAFPRILTRDGWKQERAFIDEWRSGKKADEKFSKINRCIAAGLNTKQIASVVGSKWTSVDEYLDRRGYKYKEIKALHKRYKDRRRVIEVLPNGEQDVYDLSVKDHENFATDTTVFHNCQLGDNGHMFEVKVKNKDVKEELDTLFFHPMTLNMDRKLWSLAKSLYTFGDHFLELVIDPAEPKTGILKSLPLPADSVYRIETIKGKLLEFQQSKEGPDYISLSRVEVTQATDADLAQATAIRFVPESIVHFRIGDERRMFYPYGVSLIEAARGPAHQLRLMEDAMLVYRLVRAPERRVFYIDVGGLPPFKAEMLVERLKDQLRKKKTYSRVGENGKGGASPVEERWTAQSQDEDFWIPVRPNANTRVETLPGAENLGEIDDALYFRNKLFLALNFPKNYMAQEDPQTTRVTLSSINASFAHHIERLQQNIADGLTEIAMRHLQLRGFPEEMYDDLKIQLTPPSHYRILSNNEVDEIMYNRALALKGSGLFGDLDILIRILKIEPEEAKEIVARSTAQKIQELKLSVMGANPQLMGVAAMAPPGNEMGTEAGGPSPQLTGDEQPGMDQGAQGGMEQPPQGGQQQQQPPQQQQPSSPRSVEDTYGKPKKAQIKPLPTPSQDDIEKYDMDIVDFSKGQDEEEIDTSELEDF